MLDKLIKIQQLNNQLLDILLKTALEIIKYADKHNIEIPYHIYDLTKEAQYILNQIDTPILKNKRCNLCKKFNLENADFCCYCGSSLVITRMRQSTDNTRDSDRTCISKTYKLINYC